jgi:hypothetical protein
MGEKIATGELICEIETEKWAEYHLLDPKEFYNIVLPKELGIDWAYLPRECLPNGEGVVYFKSVKHVYAETITHEDIKLSFNPHKCHREAMRRDIKIICETEKEKWEQYFCLNPDKLRKFLNPCSPRGDWYYIRRVAPPGIMAFVDYFKIGEQLYAEIIDVDVHCPLFYDKWEWDETTQRMYACARYQLTNTQKDK